MCVCVYMLAQVLTEARMGVSSLELKSQAFVSHLK